MDQNSPVERQFSPEEVQELFSIKKDAYYARMKFLNMKAAKDATGKAYLSSEQIESMTELDGYIKEHGRMEGFRNISVIEEETEAPAALATTTHEDITANSGTTPINPDPLHAEDIGPIDDLMNMAARLAAQRMAAPHLVVRELAASMTYEDLPDQYKERVDQARESIQQPSVSVGKLANSLLDQWRAKRSPVTV
jgi:hypothetical protein